MATVPWSVDYPLTADFGDVSGPDVVGSDVTPTGLTYAGFAGGLPQLLVQTGTTSATTTRYLELTLTPGVGVVSYVLGAFFLRSQRRGGSAASGWQMRSSLDGYTAVLASRSNTNTLATDTVDLSALGTLTAPVTLRIYPYAATGSTNGVYLWDWQIDGTFDNGAAMTTVEPAGIASTLVVGSPSLSLSPAAKVVRPSGVASALLVGTPSFSLAAPARVLTAQGIASTLTVGTPYISGPNPDPTEWVALPDADDVLAFLGWPSTSSAQAQAHVDVITALAREYTRRNAFGIGIVRAGVRAVIVAASARLVANPEQHSRRIGSLRQAPGFEGWTLAERAVLNDYRKVAR